MRTAIFSDFDGTITRRDVGYNLFHHFSGGKNDELVPDWKSGKISSRECLLREAEMISLTETELIEYISDFKLNPGFKELVELCIKNNYDFKIISDGLDIYINHILKLNEVTDINLFANHGRIENKKMIIDFPYNNGSCKRCGNCKGERIREYRNQSNEESRIVFVGDGYSDTCAIDEADILFAKKDLKQFCLKNNIDFISYDSFNDVISELEKLEII